IVTDPRHPTDADNPLRQVIINTHSPTVVAQVPDDSLLMAELREMARGKQIFRRLSFSCLPKTWRQEAGDCNIVSRGRLIAYLNPVSPALEDATDADDGFSSPKRPERQRMRVVDRPDLQGDLDLAPGAKIA
ncbi:MAG: ATPase, partial [Candidatus Bathyarchaeia archaeon]